MRFLSEIARFSYSARELKSALRRHDFMCYDVNHETIDDELQSISQCFYESKFKIEMLQTSKLKKNRLFRVNSLHDALCVRHTNKILKQALRTSVLDRNSEVRQLIEILKTENLAVFKGDIKSYFESVNFRDAILQLEFDGFRNTSALHHLKSLNKYLQETFNYHGLPRGISVSSTIADYLLQDFDRAIINHDGVVYYARYVDDIVIAHSAPGQTIKCAVESLLKVPLKLELNQKKTKSFPQNAQAFLDYLGYSIELMPSDPRRQREKKTPKIMIAASKIAKTKTRIILSLKAFLKERDFGLLENRLRFLSATGRMSRIDRDSPVYSGYRHGYSLCVPDDALISQLIELDVFMHSVLSSKRYSLARSVRAHLTIAQRKALRDISFRMAYKLKITYHFPRDVMSAIRRGWHYA